jgi:dipeptidase E
MRRVKRLLLASNSTQHGSGYLEHCAAAIRELLGDRKQVLFVPYARHDRDDYAEVARRAFAAFGCRVRSAHESPQPVELLADAEAVFIGGGNTFRLLRALCDTGLLAALPARIAAGVPYIGASAGSNVAGVSIRTTNDMPIVYPPTFDAMRLVPFNINPHYLDPDPSSKHMGETRETRIREFHEENTTPVVGLREGAVLRVEGARMTLLGSSGARVFRRGEQPVEHAPGADLSALLA